MGHQHLGALPRSRRWQAVVDMIGGGADVRDVAAAVSRAAERSMKEAASDPAARTAFYLLTQILLAAREEDFVPELRRLGLRVGDRPSLPEIVSAFAETVDGEVCAADGRTDFSEMVQLAATESLNAVAGRELPNLFGTTTVDVKRALAGLATVKQFGLLACDFFSRLIRRHLDYFLGRELPNHVGINSRFQTVREHRNFDEAIESHCRETARIVKEFSANGSPSTRMRAASTRSRPAASCTSHSTRSGTNCAPGGMRMAEQHIICGGLPTRGAATKEAISLDFQASNGTANRVNLKLGDLSARMVEGIPPVLTDLVEIATYVYAADRCVRRGGETMPGMGKDWFRRFRFRIPVRRPDVWTRKDVRETLVEVLGFLSDDRFVFDFVPHPQPRPGDLQAYLDYSDSVDTGFAPDDVVLFSGGLDSFAGAVESLIGHGRRVALVSHQPSTTIISKQRHLVAALRDRTAPGQLFHVPVRANLENGTGVELTQRTRSFLFATLGLVVARLFRRDAVRFYENGVVSTNLPVATHVMGSRATRTTHPRVLSGFSRLFSLILDEPITVENPYFWKTKADVVEIIAAHNCADLVAATFSCARVRQATRQSRHCGVCSQCLDRRFGILGANLEEYEPVENYVVDLFRGERQPGPELVMAEAYVLHALKLSSLSESAFFNAFGQVFRILPYLPGPYEANAQNLYNLHRRHGETVALAIDRELRRHGGLTESLSLPETSLLMLIRSPSVRLPGIVDPVEIEPPASKQAAQDRRPTIERPILFAIDDERERVVFSGGIEIEGGGFKILQILTEQFDKDGAAGRCAEEFRFMSARSLCSRLDIDQQALRQRITRFRRNLEARFLEARDVKLDTNDVIENDHWKGYRLNPRLVRVPPARVRSAEVAGRHVTVS